jgi:hypothetical protein
MLYNRLTKPSLQTEVVSSRDNYREIKFIHMIKTCLQENGAYAVI